MKQSVYIETTIVSYLTAKTSKDIIIAGRQQLTRLWWETERLAFNLVASEAVVKEASDGDSNAAEKRLNVLKTINMIEIGNAANMLAHRFVSSKCMPKNSAMDALHVAIAATNNIDYLMTWNCTHIANATIRSHLALEANLAGFTLPIICTPDELLGGKNGTI